MYKTTFTTLMLAALLVLTGCTSSPAPADPKTENTATDDRLSVVVSFYPLAYMAQQIGGDAVAVTNIVGASDPHDYTLTPGDIRAMHDAGLVLMQGAGFEPWSEDLEKQLQKNSVPTLVVAEHLTLLPYTQEVHTTHEEDEHGHEDEYAHGTHDPHTWLDPVLATQMIAEITAALAAADPARSTEFQERATELTTRFAALDATYKKGLAQCARDEVIVSHDAFGYLATRYGFSIHGIAGLSTQDEPSAQTLATLKQEAAEGMTHILTEENTTGRFAQTLAAETGLALLPVNPLAAPDAADTDFIARAEKNLTSFQTALGCTN